MNPPEAPGRAGRIVDSPLGPLTVQAGTAGLALLHLEARTDLVAASSPPPEAEAILDRADRQLGEYFAGRRTAFDLPLDQDGSAFQRAVWDALLEIPYGTTVSYGELATQLGAPGAAQAVGAACGSNPIAIVVPCHRVIGSTGRLTGYAGGLARKRDLLAFEQRDRLLF